MEPNTPPLPPNAPPPQTEKWTKTIGIITLVFGILGIFGALTALANPFLIGAQMDNAVRTGIADPTAVADYMNEYKKMQWLIVPSGFVLAAILTLGGVFLLKRKPSGPLVLRIWSVLKIVVGGFILYKGVSLSKNQLELLVGGNAAGTSQAEVAGEIASVVTKVMLVFQGMWLIALPIFLLIWFSRATIRKQIAAWHGRPAHD